VKIIFFLSHIVLNYCFGLEPSFLVQDIQH
jgi:hypothetical protein